MTNTVESVESQGEGNSELAGSLEPRGEVGHGGNEVSRVNNGVDGVEEVDEGGGVEDTGKGDTGETVETGGVPGELGLVNLEVGRVGAVETLLLEQLEFLQLSHRRGLDRAARGCQLCVWAGRKVRARPSSGSPASCAPPDLSHDVGLCMVVERALFTDILTDAGPSRGAHA